MTVRSTAWLIVTAVVIWAVCGAIMGLGPMVLSLETTLLVHLLGAPLVAAAMGWANARAFPQTTPVLSAAVVVGLALGLDAALVAPVFVGSYEMFASVYGLWAPMALIFLAVLGAGQAARATRPPARS